MKSQDIKNLDLPKSPGVYFFLSSSTTPNDVNDLIPSDILYIGKATNLKDRVKSYFGKDLIDTRGPLIVKMVNDANSIEFIETESVLEAIILESNLIKKNQPKYNTKEKDNKSFNYICITKDSWPRIIIKRGRNIDFKNKKVGALKLKSIYGPYPSGDLLRSALKIIRKIFPYLDEKTIKKDNYEFYKQLHLAPETKDDTAKKVYLKSIKHIEQFLSGEKTKIIKSLEKEMNIYAKKKEFEKANIIKKQIFALNHVNDVSLIKEDSYFSPIITNEDKENDFRIEAYDIAHLSGSSMVGAFVVVENGQINSSEHRLFNIRNFSLANDPGALEEVFSRRLAHNEWTLPDLIIVDGNQIQKNVIEKELLKNKIKIPVIAVVKDKSHKAKAMIGDTDLIQKYKKQILLANAESHRFVINAHKKNRANKFLPKK